MDKKTRIAGLLVLAVVLAACMPSAEETPTPDWKADYVPVISVTGEVVPAVWAEVSAQAGGAVLEVLVEPGDEVAAGDLLVQLDSADARLAMQQAEAALATAQAQLALLEAGPRAEEIAAVQAELKAAQAALAQATAQQDQLRSGALDAEIAAAEAQLAAALAEQRVAREAHDQTMKCYNTSGQKVCPLLGSAEEQARYALYAADEAVAAAQAQVDALKAGKGGRLRSAEAVVATAEAQRDIAQARLALLQAGASLEEIAVADAAVAQAEAALEAARLAQARSEIRAPFAGTVGEVRARTGELVVPGQPLVILGDLDTLRVETTDLDEIDVARVAVGQKADVTFDALPERVFTGRVTRIAPMAASGSGGVSYTTVVEVDGLDPAIRWGMTAFVDIEVGQ